MLILILAGLMYAIGFWVVTWRRPHLALMSILAVAPIQNDLGKTGVKFSLAEVHMALALPIFLLHTAERGRWPLMGPLAIPTALYFAACIFSSLATWRDRDFFVSMSQTFIYLVLAVCMFSSFSPRQEDNRKVMYGLLCTGTVWAVLGMATHYTFLGHNKNGMGSTIGCTLLIAVQMWFVSETLRPKIILTFCMAICAASLLLSLSRGAWLGTFCGILVITAFYGKWKSLLKVSLALLPIMALSWSLLPQDSKDYATDFGSKRYNIRARYKSAALARKYLDESPYYGAGVGLRKEYDATNLALSTLAETGVVGLAAFAWIYAAFFGAAWKAHKKLGRSHPLYSQVVIGTALMADKLAHGMVDHYWTRGVLTIAWCSAGLVIGALYAPEYAADSHRRARRAALILAAFQTHNRLRELEEAR